MAGEGIFDFILKQYEKPNLPQVCTVKRTQESKYQFYLVVRHYRAITRTRPQFFQYVRAEAPMFKAVMEEHRNPLLGTGGLYVLEGFPASFVRNLSIPDGCYVIAETEEGLELTSFNHRRSRRNQLLKILQKQLRLELKPWTLKNVLWFGLQRDEEFETVLRRAKLLEWKKEDLERYLEQTELRQRLLPMLKRSEMKAILEMMDRLGPELMHFRTTQLLGQMIYFRALRTMGYEDSRIQKEMGLGEDNQELSMRMEELKESAERLSSADLQAMVERTIELDGLLMRNRELGLSLLLLNAPIRLRR